MRYGIENKHLGFATTIHWIHNLHSIDLIQVWMFLILYQNMLDCNIKSWFALTNFKNETQFDIGIRKDELRNAQLGLATLQSLRLLLW